MSFGDKLKQARENAGISQEEFAEMLDVSRQSVSKWENGYAYPEVKTLIEIAVQLEHSLDDLFSEELSNSRQLEKKPEVFSGAVAGLQVFGAAVDKLKEELIKEE